MREKKLTTNNGQKLALVYCRVSTRGQEDGTSLQTQAEACIKRAESLGYTVGRITKEVYSGTELWDRPLLAQDREDIKAGKFQAIICYAIDRLSRDIAHLAIICEECERVGCTMIFVTEDLDTTPQGKLLRSIQSYLAEVEVEKIRERMMRGRRSKLTAGKVLFIGDGLYGYRADREAGKYVIYEPEAKIVRRIFEMCLQGYGASAIARRFNTEDIPSPKASRPMYKIKVHWCQAAIYNILKNPSYKGEEYVWRTKRVKEKGKFREKKRPQSEWIKLPDGVRPAIVSAEIWQAAQETFTTKKGAAKRNETKPVLLRGYIFCADCGRGMHLREYTRYKKGRDVYRCNSANKPYRTDCNGVTVSYEEINEWIWEQVKAILNDPSIIERELKRLEKTDPNPQLKRDLETAKKQLVKVERGLQSLLRRFRHSAENDTLLPFIEREVDQATKEKEQLEATIVELEMRVAKQASLINDLRSLKDYCKQVNGRLEKFGFEDKRLAFKALGLKVYANGREKTGWRYEINIPLSQPEPLKAASGASGSGRHFYSMDQNSLCSGPYRKERHCCFATFSRSTPYDL